MELKYRSSSVIIKTQIGSNRTFMELKLVCLLIVLLVVVIVLIVPLWN